jgi:WD40 repeat protein
VFTSKPVVEERRMPGCKVIEADDLARSVVVPRASESLKWGRLCSVLEESTTMSLFSSSSAGAPSLRDPGSRRVTNRGRVRFPVATLGRMAAIGVLSAIAVYLAEAPIRNQDDWSDSLLGDHETGVESVVFDPTGRWLASVGADGAVHLWNMDSGDLATVLQGAPESAPTFSYCLAFTTDGSSLAAGNTNGTVTLWDVSSRAHRHTFRINDWSIKCLSFSPDGLLLATASTDHGIALWDVETLRRRCTLSEISSAVNCIAFSRDGLSLVAACADGTATVWRVSSGAIIRNLDAPKTFNRDIVGIVLSTDARVLAIRSPDSGLALWHVATERWLEPPSMCRNRVVTLASSPLGETFAWGATDGTIELWDSAGGRRRSAWRGHAGAVLSLAFSPDGCSLVSGGGDRRIRIWNLTEPRIGMASRN